MRYAHYYVRPAFLAAAVLMGQVAEAAASYPAAGVPAKAATAAGACAMAVAELTQESFVDVGVLHLVQHGAQSRQPLARGAGTMYTTGKASGRAAKDLPTRHPTGTAGIRTATAPQVPVAYAPVIPATTVETANSTRRATKALRLQPATGMASDEVANHSSDSNQAHATARAVVVSALAAVTSHDLSQAARAERATTDDPWQVGWFNPPRIAGSNSTARPVRLAGSGWNSPQRLTRRMVPMVLKHPKVLKDVAVLAAPDTEPVRRVEMLNDILQKIPAVRPLLMRAIGSPQPLATLPNMGPFDPFIRAYLQSDEGAREILHLFGDAAFKADVLAQAEKMDSFHSAQKLMERLAARAPVFRRSWEHFIAHDVSWNRYVGVIGNIILLAGICILTSLKSSSLTARKAGTGTPVDMEKVMRRDIPLDELKRHSLPGDLWMAIDGLVVDITGFTTVHPGGADLLLQHAGTDATEEFKEVGHSEFAMEQIKARLVGVLVEGEGAGALASSEQGGTGCLAHVRAYARRVLPAKLLSLFTKEDPFNFHKVLGFGVVIHYLVRWYFLLQGRWLLTPGFKDPMMFDADCFSLISVWVCVLLQVSSFQFVLPRNRVLGKPMLWQEWRMHNLIFVMRSLTAFTVNWVSIRYVTTRRGFAVTSCILFATIYAQLYLADVASRNLRDSKHESLTASWPLWDGCPVLVERFLKFYYSVSINQSTTMVLMAGSGKPSLMLPFMGTIALQTDSFAMTLVRKNIISTATFHGYYLWTMWSQAFNLESTSGRLVYRFVSQEMFWCYIQATVWIMPVAVYVIRYYGLSKYGCWTGFMGKLLADILRPEWGQKTWIVCPAVWAVWASIQFGFAGFVFEYRIRRFLEGGRAKPLTLTHRERVSGSLYLLRFSMPAGYACGMMPGQHLRVLVPNPSYGKKTWNGNDNLESEALDLSRSYTPISSPDSKTFEILVKYYPKDKDGGFPEGGRASNYLTHELQLGETARASGPHGQRIFFGNGLFEVQVGKPKLRPRVVAILAGGSGITPAISVIRELQAEARRKNNWSEAWRLQDYETEVHVETIVVIHANRTDGDALPLSFYEDSRLKEQLIAIHVHNVATREKGVNEEATPGQLNPWQDEHLKASAKKDGMGGTGVGDAKPESRSSWDVHHGELTKRVVAGGFPEPRDDVLVLTCGPHNFLVNLCQPILKEIGFSHVIDMW